MANPTKKMTTQELLAFLKRYGILDNSFANLDSLIDHQVKVKIETECPHCGHELKNSCCINMQCWSNIPSPPFVGTGFYNNYYQQQKRSQMPQITVRHTLGGEIVELKFHTIPRRGWWKENAQPIIDIMKLQIPPNAREYDPNQFLWSIGKEYWPATKALLEAKGWQILDRTGQVVSDEAAHIKVDPKFAENFYHEQQPVVTKENPEDIRTKLATFLNLTDTIMLTISEVDLKNAYRRAARALHPDLGGDATQMSELNRLWAIYNSK